MKNLLSVFLIIVFLSGCQEDENQPPTQFAVQMKGIVDGWPNPQDFLKVSWTPSIDPDGGPVLYTVFLADTEIATSIPENEFKFAINDLTPNTEYSGKIVAVDNAGTQATADFSFSTQMPTEFSIKKKYEGYTVAHLVWKKSKLPDDSDALYDVYLNYNLVQYDLPDTSILIKKEHPNVLPGQNILTVIAKSKNGLSARATVSFMIHPLFTVPAADVKLRLYNIGNTSAEFFAESKYDATWSIYLNDVPFYTALGCGYVERSFPTLTGLTPNTTYRVKLELRYRNRIDLPYSLNTYEPVFYTITTIEDEFTTYSSPLVSTPEQFLDPIDEVHVKNLTRTSAEVSWRVSVWKRNCYVDPPGFVKIYVNDVLWTTLDRTETHHTLEGLTPGTTYTVKIHYTLWSHSLIQIIEQSEVEEFTLTTPE
jgi:hypothetical protein